MASYPGRQHTYSSELRVSSATLDRFGRRDDEGLTSTVVSYMRSSGFIIRATQPMGLGAGVIEFKVTAGMIGTAVKTIGAAVRWALDVLQKRQRASLNTRLPLVWIQFSAKHQGGQLPLPDAGLLAGIAAVLPGLLEHLDEKFPNRWFMIGAVSDWYETPNDDHHSRRISFNIAATHASTGRLLRIVQILEDNLFHAQVLVRMQKPQKWLPPRLKIEKSKTVLGN